jgi:hypothetical protein
MSLENTLVYRPQGGESLEVASGGSINIAAGGTLTNAGSQSITGTLEIESGAVASIESGGKLDVESGGTLSITGIVTPRHAAGTGGAKVDVSESGDCFNVTTLTLSSDTITMTDAAAAGCHGTLDLYVFAAEVNTILVSLPNLTLTAGAGGIADGAALIYSIGTAAVGTDNATLTSTEADVVPSTAATLTSGTVANVKSANTAAVVLNGNAGAKTIRLNLAVPDADSSGNDTITVSGTVTLKWV